MSFPSFEPTILPSELIAINLFASVFGGNPTDSVPPGQLDDQSQVSEDNDQLSALCLSAPFSSNGVAYSSRDDPSVDCFPGTVSSYSFLPEYN